MIKPATKTLPVIERIEKITPHRKELLVPDGLKKNNFDLIRLLLAIAVLFSHSFAIYYGMEGFTREPLQVMTLGQMTLGALAVNWFFVISGFLILNSFLHSNSVKSYLKKRALRICPGFIVAFLVSVFFFALLGTIQYQKVSINWTNYFQSLPIKRTIVEFLLFKQPGYSLCFPNMPLSNVINGSLWTIQYELICYVALPVLGLAGALKRKWVGFAMFLLFYLVMLLQEYTGFFVFETHPGMRYLSLNNVPRLFTYFFCGMCVYLYRFVIPRNNVLVFFSVVALVLASRVVHTLNIVFPIAGTYLLFYIAYSRKIRLYDFAKRGDLSYGVYLYAWPIQELVLYYLHSHISLSQFFFISLLITLLTAYFWSWKCIEKPFMELKNRRRHGLETSA